MLKKAVIVSMCMIMFAGNALCEHESSQEHDQMTIEKTFAIDKAGGKFLRRINSDGSCKSRSGYRRNKDNRSGRYRCQDETVEVFAFL